MKKRIELTLTQRYLVEDILSAIEENLYWDSDMQKYVAESTNIVISLTKAERTSLKKAMKKL